jgi:hypothetical protein
MAPSSVLLEDRLFVTFRDVLSRDIHPFLSTWGPQDYKWGQCMKRPRQLNRSSHVTQQLPSTKYVIWETLKLLSPEKVHSFSTNLISVHPSKCLAVRQPGSSSDILHEAKVAHSESLPNTDKISKTSFLRSGSLFYCTGLQSITKKKGGSHKCTAASGPRAKNPS